MDKLYCVWDLNKLKEYAKPQNRNTVSLNESKLSIQYTQALYVVYNPQRFPAGHINEPVDVVRWM